MKHNYTPFMNSLIPFSYPNLKLTLFHSNHKPKFLSSTSSSGFDENLDFDLIKLRVYKPILITMSYDQILDVNTFANSISSKVPKHFQYTYSVKMRYSDNNFIMAGSQVGFVFNDHIDVIDLHQITMDKLANSLDSYSIVDDDIVYILLSFLKMDTSYYSEFYKLSDKSITKQTLSGKLETKQDSSVDTTTSVIFTAKPEIKNYSHVENVTNAIYTDSTNIPVSVNENSLGILLDRSFDDDNNITSIELIKNNTKINFLESIRSKSKFLRKGHRNYFNNFDSSYKFYLVNINGYENILCVSKISDLEYKKIRFSLNGTVLSCITDKINDDGILVRINGNLSSHLENNEVFYNKQDIILSPIPKQVNNAKGIENPNIGVIDCETFLTSDDSIKIYSLGFKTNLSDKPVIYYIDKDFDADKIVLELIDELLRPKYENVTFYCHNFGGYDVVFILKVLLNYNDTNNKDNNDTNYILTPIFRDSRIVKLTITKKVNNSKRKLVIQDSYSMLNSSLEKLGKDFNVNTLKGIFPYKFSKQDNLFYVGNTPDIIFYNDIDNNEYNNLKSDSWNFKQETIKYLEADLLCLYEVITKANKQVFLDYGIDMTDNLTISGLALKLFLSKYYKNNIPSIIKQSMYNDIKQAYYGGITEVYRPYGENLYYYDVNSLYPYVALNDMPGLTCYKEDFINLDKNIMELFGYYYCNIETNNGYLGLLPVRNNSGIYFPNGKWSGWYFSEELKFAKQNGYKIKVIKGYSFSRSVNVFTDYINDVYKIKSYPIDSRQKAMAKSFLNNLLGRFGIKMDKPITNIMSNKSFDKINRSKKK